MLSCELKHLHFQLSWCVFDAFMFPVLCFSGALTALLFSFPFFSITHFLYSTHSHYLTISFLCFSLSLSLWSLSVLFSLCPRVAWLFHSLSLSLFWLCLRMPLSLSFSVSPSLYLCDSVFPPVPFFPRLTHSLSILISLSVCSPTLSFSVSTSKSFLFVCVLHPLFYLFSLSLSLPHVWLYQSFWLHPDCVSLSFFTSLSVPPLPQLSFFNRRLPLSLSLSVFLSVLGSHTEYGRKSSSAFSVYHHSPSVYNLIDLQPPHTHTHTHTHTHVSPKALTPRICMWISLGLPAATSILISALFMGL